MKLKQKCVLLACVLMVTAPALANFGTFRWYPGGNGNGPYVELNAITQTRLTGISGSGTGGAFEVDAQNGIGLPNYGVGQNMFTTFCVESNVTFNTNTWYWTSVDAKAYSGGAGVSGDPISDVTEWIYDQWLAGNLGAYTQTQISQAIWFAEGEAGGSANAVYNAAYAALGYTIEGPGDFDDASHTYAMNLWSGFQQDASGYWYATDKQSHLIHIPVPGAVLLGLIGLGIVQRVKRRIA